MTSSITSDRVYLPIVLKTGLKPALVSATIVSGDADGVIPQTIAQGSYSGSKTVLHNVGSIPLVRAFYDSDKNGKIYSTVRFDASGYLGYASAPQLLTLNTPTTTKLIINAFSSVSDVPVYYKIYRFGTKGLTSDEEIDKIFGKGTNNNTVSAAVGSDVPVLATSTIPHNAGELIMWELEFAESSTGPWYKAGTPLFGAADTASGPPGGPYARYFYKTAYGYADSTNFYINYVHNYASPQTIYTRFVQDYME